LVSIIAEEIITYRKIWKNNVEEYMNTGARRQDEIRNIQGKDSEKEEGDNEKKILRPVQEINSQERQNKKRRIWVKGLTSV
jgi:hypothetical protein